MSKLNLLLNVNIYNDPNPTNKPTQNNVDWSINVVGMDVAEPCSKTVVLAPSETKTLFSGEVETAVDNTTSFDLLPKSGASNTFILAWSSGSKPEFRLERDLSQDATSELTLTKVGGLLEIESTGGTPIDFLNSGVVVGDELRLGDEFNSFNRGKFKVLSVDSDKITVQNYSAENEVVILGVNFLENIKIYSSSGVQIGDTLDINENFNSFIRGSYEITDVYPDRLEFHSSKLLPSSLDEQSEITIFNNLKQFLYLEVNKTCQLEINGENQGDIEPLSVGVQKKNGILLKTGKMYQATITNKTLESATVFMVNAE
jgi:hypothetical protein